MPKMICVKCGLEFPSDAIYLAHKKGDHLTNLDKGISIEEPPIPESPPGISPEALPSPEFIEQINRIENKEEIQTPPSQHPTELPEAEPIKLIYLFKGQCPEHRTPIDTLELDVSDKHFVIAVCSTNKEQLETKEVASLWEK